MKATLLVLGLWCICLTSLSADEAAISSSGKRVLLNDNGTWSIVKETNFGTKDFRNCKWGMTKNDVLKAEKLKASDLSYNEAQGMGSASSIASLSCQVLYIFAHDKLVRSKYYITESHSNNNLFVEQDYPKLKELLIKKYGPPVKEDTLWSNDLYKDSPQEWGMALVVGHLSFYCSWETEKTAIVLYLSGDNFKVNFGIEYSSKEWGGLEQQQTEDEITGKL